MIFVRTCRVKGKDQREKTSRRKMRIAWMDYCFFGGRMEGGRKGRNLR